ncbi:Uncharacterised protein [Bordetella ansorpii]|uniref:Uncharacterized protein n=1 Tax=Bordetella ansorpii TaxID=288768 RepID=A0A157L446_9BORD|nr:hypothetical protein [Bordetella ansorpii]SAH91447.1 Uncharacterised protein [Bordetella ansorpii]
MTDPQRQPPTQDASARTHQAPDKENPGQPDAQDDRSIGPGEPRPPMDSPEEKATQFDGNPNPGTDDSPRLFKPRDDTPAFLKKKSGPKN